MTRCSYFPSFEFECPVNRVILSRMCPLWPFHIVILYVLALLPIFVATVNGINLGTKLKSFNVEFNFTSESRLTEHETTIVCFEVDDIDMNIPAHEFEYDAISLDDRIIEVTSNPPVVINNEKGGYFNLTGKFIGYTEVQILRRRNESQIERSKSLRVGVKRAERPIDKAFTGIIVLLVSIAFINMGCSLDLKVVKETLRRPVGPMIGFVSQFAFMPLCAFVLGLLLFPKNPELQLGLFVTGCSPGGGGSNLWTYILDGNLNLSVTMTCISTFAAFAMIPFWSFTLGRIVFSQSAIQIPYMRIVTMAAGLVVPLAVGIAIRRFLPRVADVLVKMLKPMASLFIVFIIVFGVYTNLYMFQIMGWQVFTAGFSLPFLGYCFGAVAAYLLRRPIEDVIAISVETGLQNTGIAIFLLRFTLPQPDADLNTVVPVASAIMTPLPLTIALIILKLRAWKAKSMETEKKAPSTILVAHDSITPLTYVEA
ncbi:hypothetical protein QYM36_014490 [Artemia franciscana]|uniref:Ileal sodium/bile acid cotransporter n=3 Tax=Artemia franciscana TaxID=6661 RepID=A0AA88HCI8_ARTSF|nr:hypothetical protein QYM36_014490 [Artemia franciscana]